MQTLNSGNCLLYHRLACFYFDDDLGRATISFFCRNFKAVLNENHKEVQEFITLDLWRTILMEETITVQEEWVILDALCLWISHDVETRAVDFEPLMEYVKKDEISSEKWSDLLQKYTQLESFLLKSMIKGNDFSIESRSKRNRASSFLVAVGFDSQDVEYLDLNQLKTLDQLNSRTTDCWRILTKIPIRYGLSGASLAVHNNCIFVTGGVGPRGILKAVKRLLVFDILANEWKVGPSMNHARKCHGCYIKDNTMYVIGGTDSQQPVMNVESLYLDSLPLTPLTDSNKIEDVASSELWKVIATLGSWHNGSAGLLGLENQRMVAISVYGTDHDKDFSLNTQ